MKSEEKTYLRSIHGDYSRVCDLEESQFNFKVIQREYKKALTKIKNLEKQVEKLKMKNSKTFKIVKTSNNPRNIFLADMKEVEKKANRRACKKYMYRVTENLESGKWFSKNYLLKELLIPPRQINNTIGFLLEDGILESKIEEGRYYYKII